MSVKGARGGMKVFEDIEGLHGTMSIVPAQKVTSTSCIVQESPEAVTEGEFKIPSELRGVEVLAYDSFTGQPVKGAHTYGFHGILHD